MSINDRAGDIDVATEKYFIKCKNSATRNLIDNRIKKQLLKYLDSSADNYMNVNNKKVILAINKLAYPEILKHEFLKEMQTKYGLIIITDLEQLKKLK